MLSRLTADEKQQIQDALSCTDEANKEPSEGLPTESPIEEVAPEISAEENKKEDKTDQVEEATAKAEPTDQEETDEQSASFDRGEESAQTQANEYSQEVQEAQEQSQNQEEFVPQEDQEQESNMPVDYQSIIDGLNAKIMALEAENKELKAKTDGAFGLVAKPGMAVKANSLYDDDVSDIHFKK